MAIIKSDLFDELYAVFLYDELEQYEETIVELTEHLATNPTNGIAYNNRAVAHGEIGEWQEAASDFALAIEHAGPNPGILKNWGFLLERAGDLEAAIDKFREATWQSPADATLHRCLGGALMKVQRPAEAADSFSRAIRIERRFPRTYLDRAAAYTATGARLRAAADRTIARFLELTGEPQRGWRRERMRQQRQ